MKAIRGSLNGAIKNVNIKKSAHPVRSERLRVLLDKTVNLFVATNK